MDTDEELDSENPNYEPIHNNGAQLLSQTDHDDTTLDEDNSANFQNSSLAKQQSPS